MIETYAYARAGLLGNPSDGYYGKTISFILKNFRARVLLYPSARLEIKTGKADTPIWEHLEDLRATTRWRGYYGGLRVIQALLMRFTDYCLEQGIELHDRNFTIEYESTIPLRLGMGGSSAIIIATLRALQQFFEIELSQPVQANLALQTETLELGVGAGLQDRVIQVYEGLVFMDFARELMAQRGFGDYQPLDAGLLPNIYVAYRTSLSEGTEVFHNNIRARFEDGDPVVVNAMQRWAAIAEEGKQALLAGDTAALNGLINENFDLRSKVYRISEGNLEMVRTARSVGASAKFAGSGGAIVGAYEDEAQFERLREALSPIGVAVLKPKM
ncbi:MAG: GHMP kinase [Acidobacteria bacterium]|nr:GHMP kinase [Acidobacteriota bacterium]